MNRPPSASVEHQRAKGPNVDVSTGSKHEDQPSTPEDESSRELLKRICDLLEIQVHRQEEQQRCEDDKENEMNNDWMLAAAVLDCICGIAFTVVLIGGTLVFFVMFAVHP